MTRENLAIHGPHRYRAPPRRNVLVIKRILLVAHMYGGGGGLLHKVCLKCFFSGVAGTGKRLPQHMVIVGRGNR